METFPLSIKSLCTDCQRAVGVGDSRPLDQLQASEKKAKFLSANLASSLAFEQ